MVPQQVQQIITEIEKIEGLNFEKVVAEAFKEDPEQIDSKYWGEFTAGQMVEILDLGLKNLKSALESQPSYYFQYQIWRGNTTQPIQTILQSIRTHITNKDFKQIRSWLLWFTPYLVEHNLWGPKAERTDLEDQAEEIERLNSKIKLLSESYDKQLEKVAVLEKKLSAKVGELNTFKQQKQTELQSIATNLKSAQEQVNQINSLFSSASGIAGRIQGIEDQQNNKLTEVTNKLGSAEQELKRITDGLESFNKEKKQLLDEVEAKKTAFQSRLDETETEVELIKAKRDEALKMLGVTADSINAYAFTKRVTFLKWTIGIWGVISLLTVTGAIFWIYLVFSNWAGVGTEETGWAGILINTVKTVPAIILIFFAFRQYNKERKYLEAYALKSGIARTMDAYSEKFAQEKKEEMLMETIRSIYENPDKKVTEEKGLLEGIDAKELLKEILAVLKSNTKGDK
jgi:uncharacterized membrane protein